MGFWRYAPEELPATMSRIVRWRWPGEHLLLTVPCRAQLMSASPEWDVELADAASTIEPGALGVTDARLLYRNFDRPSPAYRMAAGTFAGLALLGAVARDGTGLAPVAAVLALVLWGVSRLVEAMGLGSGSIEFGRIVRVDRLEHRIDGVDRWGISYRLVLDEPDLDRIAGLLPG